MGSQPRLAHLPCQQIYYVPKANFLVGDAAGIEPKEAQTVTPQCCCLAQQSQGETSFQQSVPGSLKM